ncbi:MAG: GtrA family protein [Treponema sp.]|nr:GtrA family protein [Treponema sp.]
MADTQEFDALTDANPTEQKKDLFDKLMSLPLLRIFEPFFSKHREGLLYLFFGGLAFFLNMILFFLFHTKLGMQEGLATAICWVLCVLFQYFTNKTWVFRSTTSSGVGLLKEITSFFGGRIFTLLVEEAIIFVFITWLGNGISSALALNRNVWDMIVKLFAQFVIIVLNYVISKLFVFTDKKKDTAA